MWSEQLLLGNTFGNTFGHGLGHTLWPSMWPKHEVTKRVLSRGFVGAKVGWN